jgi:hypothetical protein
MNTVSRPFHLLFGKPRRDLTADFDEPLPRGANGQGGSGLLHGNPL